MKKIGFKFAVAIMLLTLISIGALGILARSLTTITTSSQELMNNQVEKTDLIHSIYEDYLDMYMNMYAHVNTKLAAVMDKRSEEIYATREEMWQKMEAYESQITSEEAQTAYDTIKDRLVSFDQCVDSIIEASRKNDKEQANILITNNLSMLNDTIQLNMQKLLEYSAEELKTGKADLQLTAAESEGVILAAMILLVAAAVLVTIIAIRIIVVPIRRMAKVINKMIEDIHNGQGDLTSRVPVQTKDEISTLAQGVNEFLDILQDMIGGVISCGQEIEKQQQNVTAVVDKTNDNARETSSTMEELAASIEEVSSTVAYVNENTKQAEESVEMMIDKAVSGTQFAEEIRNRAQQLQKVAKDSRESAGTMIGEFDSMLQSSIEDSRKIENISNLTGDILSIASKTNLLALNASIEAARAGEAGRGFAVVADEIRVLADNSKETANNIQAISEEVVEAVTVLAENARSLIAFINERILPDYETMERTGEQYLNDSITVDRMMAQIRDSMEQIGGMMRTVVESNDNITGNVQESAQGVMGVVNNTTALADNMKDIIGALEQVSGVINHLSEQTACFKS
ncbi:MAG: methyl-accepting chemotaxis protein [Lachnospiraceae bacterium]|nr:methyl-accepting chemotaxis protein [Lachnospiraceae bacterium]